MFKVGMRVRFNEKSPWPERVGCTGTIVTNLADTYPTPGPTEELVRLDADPLGATREDAQVVWTCVTTRQSLDLLDVETP